MSRPNSKWLILPALVLAVVAVACGGGGEEKTLLNKYFMASKVADNMTLSNIATVVFDPKSDGQMMSFNIVSVSEPKVTALTIKTDAEALKAAVDDEKAFTEKKKAFQDANSDVIDRIIKAEGANQPAERQGRRGPERVEQVARGDRDARQADVRAPPEGLRGPADHRDQLPGSAQPDRHDRL